MAGGTFGVVGGSLGRVGGKPIAGLITVPFSYTSTGEYGSILVCTVVTTMFHLDMELQGTIPFYFHGSWVSAVGPSIIGLGWTALSGEANDMSENGDGTDWQVGGFEGPKDVITFSSATPMTITFTISTGVNASGFYSYRAIP